jgi:hypothetical protein
MSNNNTNSENEDDYTIVEHDLLRIRALLGDSDARTEADDRGLEVGESLDLASSQIKDHLKTLRAYLFDEKDLPEGFPKNIEKSLKRHFDRLDEDEKNAFKGVLDNVIDYTYQNNDSNNNWGGGRRRGTRKHRGRRSTHRRTTRRRATRRS